MHARGTSTSKIVIGLFGVGVLLVVCALVLAVGRKKGNSAEGEMKEPLAKAETEDSESLPPPRRPATRVNAVSPKRSLEGNPLDEIDPTKAPAKGAGDSTGSHSVSATQIMDLERSTFMREAKDRSWSDNAAGRIRVGLTGHLPSGSSINNVECRTTICSVELQHRDAESYHEFVRSALLGANDGLWGGPFSAIITNQDESGVRAQVFIAREGYSLPQPTPELAN
jgi:hypothetical protein